MSAPPESANEDVERRDALYAMALEGMLTRLRIPVDDQRVLLVSDRPGVYDDRLLKRGGILDRGSAAGLGLEPLPPHFGEDGTFGLILWLDGGPESPTSLEFERAVVTLARALAPGGWLGLALTTPRPVSTGPDDPEHHGWGHWATTLWSCGLTVHDVRMVRRFSGPGVRVPAWLRPFPGLAYRIDRGLVMSGLRLGGNGARLVMARRAPAIIGRA